MAKKEAFERHIPNELRKYELMLIMSPELLESALNKKLKEIKSQIETVGGEIMVEDVWGKQDLAYRIKGFDEGIYVVYHFTLPQTELAEFRQFLRLEKEVVRSLVISIPDGLEYTKYDMTTPEEAPEKKKGPRKNVSIKHNAPVTPSKSDDSDKANKKEGKAPDAEKLDKKLDSILEGEDLNL